MNDYDIQQGETLRLMVTVEEEGASTAELVAILEDGTDEITKEANFDGLTADLSIDTPDSQTPGEYPYYVRITWDDSSVDILTKPGDCEEGDCPLPVITVCELNQVGS